MVSRLFKTGKEFKFFPVFFSLVYLPFCSNAQKLEIGIGLGGLTYKGDISPNYNISFIQPALNVVLKHNFNQATVLRASFIQGYLSADASKSPNPYISKKIPKANEAPSEPTTFNTAITEFGLMGEYNFFNYRDPKNPHLKGSPYLFGGAAVFIFNNQPYDPGKDVRSIQPSIPFGVGYKRMISRQLNFSIEFGARKTFTDYIDRVSDVDLDNQQIGFKYNKDWYSYIGATITYTIYKVECPF